MVLFSGFSVPSFLKRTFLQRKPSKNPTYNTDVKGAALVERVTTCSATDPAAPAEDPWDWDWKCSVTGNSPLNRPFP